jgi:uncharacterized protein YyaL (SSP411 family)
VQALFLPTTTVLLADGGPGQEFLGRKLPEVAHLAPPDRACAYVCRDFTCSLPTTEIEELVRLV